MKRFILKGAMLLAVSVLTPVMASAQSLGSLLKNVATSAVTDGTASSLITSLLGTSKVSQSDLVGTWTYDSPAVVFESDNLLNKAAGTMMQAVAEKKIKTTFAKYGLNAGKIKITFKSDSTYECNWGKLPSTGTYEVSGSTLTLNTLVPARKTLRFCS